jgi:O-antigen/teichoic acid export membrane protein
MSTLADNRSIEAPATFRNRRIASAWVTSLASKGVTLLSQGIALPAVYRSLGAEAYAAYAAVTSLASLASTLNLGLGAALVTPVAKASNQGDTEEEARVVIAVFVPLVSIALLVALALTPVVILLPLPTMFGAASTTVEPGELRIAAALAFGGALASVPLSVFGGLRQAYQELHVNNLIGAATNAVLCAALLVVWMLGPTLPWFVAVVVLIPVLGQVANGVAMICSRPYLVRQPGKNFKWRKAAGLAVDGSAFSLASFSHLLIYQWPVYYLARTAAPALSSTFAVYVQVIVLVKSFIVGLLAPIWGAAADAKASNDSRWLRLALRRTRVVVVLFGIGTTAFLYLFGHPSLSLWLGKSLELPPVIALLIGFYILLTVWEYAHFVFALGLGYLRQASMIIVVPALLFASVVPLAARVDISALFACQCASLLLVTAWLYPRLVNQWVDAVT